MIEKFALKDTTEYKAYLFILIRISLGLIVAYGFNLNDIQIEHRCPIHTYFALHLRKQNPVRSTSSIQ